MESLKLYESREATYPLDPAKVFSVVDRIHRYCRAETAKFDQAVAEGQDHGITYWVGDDRTITVITERRAPGSKYAHLAELVLREDGKSLSLNIHAHTHLMADPTTLEHLGEIFRQPQKTQ